MRSDSIKNTLRALGCVHTIPDSFCAATKIISDRASVQTKERLWRRDFCNGAKLRRAAPRRSQKWKVTYRIGVHTIPDSFCAATKMISDRASIHIMERLWRRDFCDGAKLRRAVLISKVESHISDRCSYYTR